MKRGRTRMNDKLILLLQKPDNPGILVSVLREAFDCDIISVSEGALFDRLLRNCRPDLIVLDLSFAGADGAGLLSDPDGGFQRETGHYRKVPVIGIARRNEDRIPPAVLGRVDTILSLPFHRDQFVAAVTGWLTCPPAVQAAVQAAGQPFGETLRRTGT